MLLSHCSQFLFALSAFLCEDVHECGNGEVSAAAAAAAGAGAAVVTARLGELLSLQCSMQLSLEVQEANWNRCGINPSLGELC